MAGLSPDTEYTYRILIKGEEWASGERWDWSAKEHGLVQSGGNASVALQNAATAQRNNLLAAKSSVDVRNIGDAYSNFSDIFNRSKQQSEYRRGLQDYGNEFGFLGNGGKT